MRIKKILVFIFILSFPISLFLMRGDEKVKNSTGSLYLIKSSDYTTYEKTLPSTNKHGFKKFK